MSGYGRSRIAIALVAAGALGLPLQQVQQQQTQTLEQPARRRERKRGPAISLLHRARYVEHSVNGGQRRKRAIRAARLRKYGTKKHGKYR